MGQVNVMEVQDSERAIRMICDMLMRNQGFQIMINVPYNEGPEGEAVETVSNKKAHDLEKDVTDIIHEIGVPAHIKGYQYLREAIILASKDKDDHNAILKNRYSEVAEIFGTTEKR